MKKILTSGRPLIAGLLLSGTMLMAPPAQAQADPPPNVPTNLDALPDGAGNLVVSWTLPAGQEITASGVLLVALPVSDPPVALGAPCGAGATSCAVPGYQVGTAYGVVVFLTDSEGFPVQSDEYLQVATLALPGGSQQATVRWHGPVTGQTAEAPVCVLSGSPGFTTRSAEDLQSQGAPAGAAAPLGVLQFQATGCGPEETTRVVIDYPAGTLTGLKAYKYGPPETGAASNWFAHGVISGDRVTYAVVNNGVGDSDSDLAAINDPFAPLDVPPPAYTVGGSITGLTGSGLVLRNNGGDDLPIAAQATSFAFTAPVVQGGAYAVTVQTQPAGQTCTVTNGSGTAGSNVTDVSVNCQAVPGPGTGGVQAVPTLGQWSLLLLIALAGLLGWRMRKPL